MKLHNLFFATMFLCMFGCATGSTELAKAAKPSPVLFQTATQCLAQAAQVLQPAEAAKFCLEVRTLEADRAKNAAEQSSKSQQAEAQRPVIVVAPTEQYRYSTGIQQPRGVAYCPPRQEYVRTLPMAYGGNRAYSTGKKH